MSSSYFKQSKNYTHSVFPWNWSSWSERTFTRAQTQAILFLQDSNQSPYNFWSSVLIPMYEDLYSSLEHWESLGFPQFEFGHLEMVPFCSSTKQVHRERKTPIIAKGLAAIACTFMCVTVLRPQNDVAVCQLLKESQDSEREGPCFWPVFGYLLLSK